MHSQPKTSGFEFGFAGLEQFKLADYKRLLLRRKWLITSAILVCGVGTAIVARFLPESYVSSAVVQVVPKKVPDTYVSPGVTSGASDRLAALRRELLSSTRLTQIIESMALYGSSKGHKVSEGLVNRLRQDIEIEPIQTNSEEKLEAFKISFKAHNPVQAAQVANRFTSLLIEENTRYREQQVVGTAEFLNREFTEAQKEVEAKERQIQEIKSRYGYSGPESHSTYVETLANLQVQWRDSLDAVSRAQEQKFLLQSAGTNGVKPASTNMGPSVLEERLVEAESQLQQLRSLYSANHPDVIKKSVEVEELTRKLNSENKSRPAETQELKLPEAAAKNILIANQLNAFDAEIQKQLQRQKELKKQIASYQAKLERFPVAERELVTLTREYEGARERLKQLQDRKFSADMSVHLETYQKDERFAVLDPAQVPTSPVGPDRFIVSLGGLPGGALVGLALALLLEVLDSTAKTGRQAAEQLQFPLLGELSWYPNQRQKRRGTYLTLATASGNVLLAVVYIVLLISAHR